MSKYEEIATSLLEERMENFQQCYSSSSFNETDAFWIILTFKAAVVQALEIAESNGIKLATNNEETSDE